MAHAIHCQRMSLAQERCRAVLEAQRRITLRPFARIQNDIRLQRDNILAAVAVDLPDRREQLFQR